MGQEDGWYKSGWSGMLQLVGAMHFDALAKIKVFGFQEEWERIREKVMMLWL